MAAAAPLPTTTTSLVPPPVSERRIPERQLTGIKKAAILVVAVGDELGKKILQNLPDTDVQRLTEEIAELRNVRPEASLQVMEEFFEMIETQRYMMHGGLEYATKLLVESFGKQRAEDLLALVKRAQEASQGDLAMLQKVDPGQLGKFLDGEHPQTIALVLAHLDPKRASLVLNNLDEGQKVALILHKRLETVGDTSRKAYAGFKAVADLLNRLDAEQTKKILEQIEEDEPDVALNIRNLMFTFEDLVTVPSTSMRELVSAIDKPTLAMALKGAREDVRAHIFRAMSSRAVEMLKEDMEVLGPVRTREVTLAQHEILNLARKLEADGKLILKIEQGDDLLV